MDFIFASNNDDDINTLNSIVQNLGKLKTAKNGNEFNQLILGKKFDVVFIDINFEKNTAFQILKKLQQHNHLVYDNIKVVMCCHEVSAIAILHLYARENFIFISKPFTEKEVIEAITKLGYNK